MKADKIDQYIKNLFGEIKQKVINEETKEQLIYELGKTLKFYLLKISDEANMMCEDSRENIKKALGDDVFVCGRVWAAWNVGTMTQEDFSLASESDDLIDNLYNSIE